MNKRLNDENPYNHIRQKSNDDWYMYWLCEDKEFRHDLVEHNEWIYLRAIKNSNLPITKLKDYKERQKSFLNKYKITDDEFDLISTGLHLQYPLDFPFKILDNHDDIDNMTIVIPRDTKRKDYIAAWDYIQELFYTNPTLKPKSERNRSAENTQLIYAISKARGLKKTFREIFNDYQNGNLDCYSNRSTSQFKSEDELEKYYDKYKPHR